MKNHIRHLIIIVVLQITALALVQADDVSYSFTIGEGAVLRNSSLGDAQSIEPGSTIKITEAYLQRYLGTANPTQEQIQRLLLNPEEATKGKIDVESFRNVGSRSTSNDYFFQVNVVTPKGENKSGKMALQYYFRHGHLTLKRSDGVDPSSVAAPDVETEQRQLIENNRTEADTCTTCGRPGARTSPTAPLTDVGRAAGRDTSRVTTNGPLWDQYQSFARDFSRNNRVTRSNVARMKRKFIKSMIDRFGIEKASKMMEALTVFGEAPYRRNDKVQIAEGAAIMKVINNRAALRLYKSSRTLRDIGISASASPLLTNILADWQFSAWNDGRGSTVPQMLNFNPDTAGRDAKEKMRLAFAALDMMDNNKITFNGQMNNSRMVNYHANYVTPNWARRSTRITSPTIVVDGTTVNLNSQPGARHIFYVSR